MIVRESSGAPMILLAAFTMHCWVFEQEAVKPPHHIVMQLVVMLLRVPLQKEHIMGGGTCALLSLRRKYRRVIVFQEQ